VRVLITGGAGFIGRHLTRALLRDGHEIRILDCFSEQVHGPDAAVPAELNGAEVIRGDVRDKTGLTAALAGVDAVAHLAAETGVGQSMYEVDHYVDVNDRGTACLLQALARERRPVRVVLASSRAVYGEGLYACPRCGEVSPLPRDAAVLARSVWDAVCPACGGAIAPVATHEDAPCRPGSVYAATKLAQEHLCQIVGAAYGLPTIILRYFNVYGPGQSLSNPYTGILSAFFARARSGKAIEVYEDGRESRDFVYVDDVVEATRRALLLGGDATQPQVLNVGSGAATSVLDLAQAMLRGGGWSVPVQVTGAFRVGDVRHAVADTRRAREVLGFRAAVPLEEGLRRWLTWAAASDAHDATDVAMSALAERGLYRTADG
jgi:dTDP-L-rhamnose 4-epimerase